MLSRTSRDAGNKFVPPGAHTSGARSPVWNVARCGLPSFCPKVSCSSGPIVTAYAVFGESSDAFTLTAFSDTANAVAPFGGAGLSASAPSDFGSIGVVNASCGLPLVKRPGAVSSTLTKRRSSCVWSLPVKSLSLGRLPSRGTTPAAMITSYCLPFARSVAGTST